MMIIASGAASSALRASSDVTDFIMGARDAVPADAGSGRSTAACRCSGAPTRFSSWRECIVRPWRGGEQSLRPHGPSMHVAIQLIEPGVGLRVAQARSLRRAGRQAARVEGLGCECCGRRRGVASWIYAVVRISQESFRKYRSTHSATGRVDSVNAISIDHRRVCMRAALLIAVPVSLLGVVQDAAAAASSCEARAASAHEVILAGTPDNWEPVSDQAVLIWAKRSERAYFVRLDRRLHGLTAAAVIDLVDGDHDRSISPCGHDGITIGDGEGIVARIVSIELLSAKRTAEFDQSVPAVRADSFAV